MSVDFSALDETLDAEGDVPQPKRGRGRPTGSKNKPKPIPTPKGLGGYAGPRERAPSQVPFEVYTAPDPLAMVQSFYHELGWRIDTLRNQRKLHSGVGNRQGLGVEANELLVPILTDTANTLLKALQAHDKAMAIADKLSKGKTPAQLLEISIQKIEGQDLATLRGIIKRLRQTVEKLAPVSHADKVQMGEAGFGKVGAAEGLAALAEEE